jgi:hypothetical protein
MYGSQAQVSQENGQNWSLPAGYSNPLVECWVELTMVYFKSYLVSLVFFSGIFSSFGC